VLFNSPEFIFLFLPVVVALHYAAARRRVEAAVVSTTLASLVFYAWWSPVFVVLPVASIAGNVAMARAIATASAPWSRRLLLAGIVGNLAPLVYFKYADFLLSTIAGIDPAPPNVPLALSFTTFVQIALLVDVHRSRQAPDLRRYALFVVFFPHLIAGPIVRWRELGPQMEEPSRYRPDWTNLALGVTTFLCGLVKKMVIADPLAAHVAPVFEAAARGDAVTAAAAWGAAFGYATQLYFDFSGYSDMAVGLALLFNLRLPLNFAAPFRATSAIDFWRRWHVTLSRFLRDHVYVPLGGGRRGGGRRAVNLLVTMALGGLWHGAAWTYVAWGAFHGALLAVNHALRWWRGPRSPSWAARVLGWPVTLTSFAVGMVFFRAASLGAAWRMITAMAGGGGATAPDAIVLPWDDWIVAHGYVSETFIRTWFGATWSVRGTVLVAVTLAIALVVPDTMELTGYREGEPGDAWRRPVGPLAWRPSLPWLGAAVAMFALAFHRLTIVKQFLYFQF
jgi:D-alanyl-lipoteichoic acid acyltransferase DltB (MBOAT superfamily)